MVRVPGMLSSSARRRFVSRRSLPRETGMSKTLPFSCAVRAGFSPRTVSSVIYTRPLRTDVSTHLTFHALSKNASFCRSSTRFRFAQKVANALSVASRMRSAASACAAGSSSCSALTTPRGGFWASCTRALALDGWRILGLRSASISASEKPVLSGMQVGSTKGSLSSKISTSLKYPISPVLGIQTLTRGELGWHPRKTPQAPLAPLEVSVTRG